MRFDTLKSKIEELNSKEMPPFIFQAGIMWDDKVKKQKGFIVCSKVIAEPLIGGEEFGISISSQ